MREVEKPTIAEVAKLAGVSVSTVSRFLNKSGPVSEKTGQKILKAVKMLKYHPNGVARSLVSKRTNTIGIIVPDMRNPFFSELCWYVEDISRKYNYSVIICNADNHPNLETRYLDVLLERNNVDGILFINGAADHPKTLTYLYEIKQIKPIVLLDKRVEHSDIPSVTVDNILGGKTATNYLIGLGHERIGFITSRFTLTEREREEGYKQALKEHSIIFDEDLVAVVDEHVCKTRSLDISFLLEKKPTALFVSNDFKALSVYYFLEKHGIKIPEDISVMGYDNIDITELINPPLTTMKQPIKEMASTAINMLIKIIQGEKIPPPQLHITFQAELIERQSTSKVN